MTGFSGAGKTTLAKAFIDALGRPVTWLDGDDVRETLCADLGFSKEDRDTNVARIAYVAKQLVDAGQIVVVSCISPYAEARVKARETIGKFVEVKVFASADVRADRNGHPGEYESGTADIDLNTGEGIGPESHAAFVINALVDKGYLGTAFMLGRYQPWHDGHTALFREALKEGRVLIGLRPDKHYGFDEVETSLRSCRYTAKRSHSLQGQVPKGEINAQRQSKRHNG